MKSTEDFWAELFGPGARPDQAVRLEMRAVRKRGRPFLLLPGTSRAAARVLDLYPAQTPRARIVRAGLRSLLRLGVAFGAEKMTLSLSPDDPFAKFLSELLESSPGGIPIFGILAGNPAHDSQRFLLLVFDTSQRPLMVVKAGLSQRAQGLVAKEAAFLKHVPPGPRGIPKLRAIFEIPRLQALALDFFAGDSPRAGQERALPELLASWVSVERQIQVTETADWLRLEKAAAAHKLLPALRRLIGGRSVRAAIHHGDFAPWNIKVSPRGDWMVLDWERGELEGIPGWDWFHYVIQVGILVEGRPAAGLIARIENLLASEAFRHYATRAGIAGLERPLVLAYLLHCVEVIKPAEGLAPTQALLEAFASRIDRQA